MVITNTFFVTRRSASFFDSIFGLLEIEDTCYKVLGTREGAECFRDNDAGGQDRWEPQVFYTDRLVVSDEGRYYWIYRNSRNHLFCDEISEAQAALSMGKWYNGYLRNKEQPTPGEFYLNKGKARIVWKSEIKKDAVGDLYILE